MATYAATTSVSTEASRSEIERTLERYKADAFAYSRDGAKSQIAFRMGGRYYRFVLILPEPTERRFTHHSRGMRTDEAARKEWEQACRQKWRALALVIKAKLEAVDAGISTVEAEFMAATVLPEGQTVGEWMAPQIDEAYSLGHMPKTLMLEGPR